MINENMDISDSITVHDFRVCFSSIPRYFPINQKPLSFTCESIVDPAAIETTIKAFSISPKPIKVTTGAIIPAAVIIATVADPCVTRMTMAMMFTKNLAISILRNFI